MFGRPMMIGDPDLPAVRIHLQRHAGGEGGGFNSGNRRHPFNRLVVELTAALDRVAQRRGVRRQDRQAIHREARAGALGRRNAPRQQRRDDEQQGGDSHLARDQRVAQRPAAAGAAWSHGLASKIGGDIRLRRLDGGRQAREQPGKTCRAEREREHADVDA